MNDRHVCPLPARWTSRATWRCPDGHLWAIDTACAYCRWLGKGEAGMRHVCTPGHAWWPAPRWRRHLHWLRHAGRHPMRRARLDMASGNRAQELPKGAPDDAPPLPDYDG